MDEIAADPTSTWQRLLTDPASGRLLDIGRTRYRPPPGIAAFVRARNGECRHPTCRRTATTCELDHVTEWQHGGHTSEDNLCALCARHHDLKEHHGWQVVLHHDRTVEWTTPTGHRCTSPPADHRDPEPLVPLAATSVARTRPGVAELVATPTAEDGRAPFCVGLTAEACASVLVAAWTRRPVGPASGGRVRHADIWGWIRRLFRTPGTPVGPRRPARRGPRRRRRHTDPSTPRPSPSATRTDTR